SFVDSLRIEPTVQSFLRSYAYSLSAAVKTSIFVIDFSLCDSGSGKPALPHIEATGFRCSLFFNGLGLNTNEFSKFTDHFLITS
ncbi:hypothetical protein ABEX47_20260, partial [Paenibacillus ehimensis]|uniref:hypothetical protein n=1 Tax=Paenibacillus ehimensis TaxID=79264 RepID=UPI003D2CF306